MATTSLDRKDVVIASAFGRGHWLADHLAEQGWKVTLLDFTHSLGEFSPEDYDGPFGLLETDLISGSQKAHWALEFGADSSELVANGFTLWLQHGPLEGHGQLATFLSQEHSLSLAARNYLHMVSDLSDIRLKAERVQLAKLPFQNTWLVRLMHQIHSNTFSANHLALETEHAMPFFSPYRLRSSSKGSHEAALKLLRAKNIEVIEAEVASAVIPESDEQATVQVTANGSSQNIFSRSVAWMLSSSETQKVAKGVMRAFYPNGEITKTWEWQRFEVQFSEQPTEVPKAFVILQDPHLPWVHTNLVVVRTDNESWSCWLKLPSSRIKDAEYREKQILDLETLISKKLPWSGPKVRDGGGVNPPWAIYDSEQKRKLRTQFSKNIFISGPEHSDGVDPLSQMLLHREILSQLEAIRRIWDARQLKRETKEAMRLQKQKEKDERKRLQ